MSYSYIEDRSESLYEVTVTVVEFTEDDLMGFVPQNINPGYHNDEVDLSEVQPPYWTSI